MECCKNHDRMDLILDIEEYNDFPCGTPTNPRGEPRFCCRACPSRTLPLHTKAVWAGNPVLMAYLTPEEQAAVLRDAIAAGPDRVDIRTDVPAPAPNAEPESA